MSEKKYWDEKIETLPRADLEELQRRELKDILTFAYSNSAYYKEAFNAAGLTPADFNQLEDIQKFPFTNKATQRERQAKGGLLGDMIAVSEDDVVFVSASSGSTGVPTLSPFTKQDFDEWQDVESRLFYGAGMRKHDRYVHALNFSLFVGGPDVIGAQNLGALCIWAGTVPSERLLFILKEFQPTIIWTTPSYALYLGETALKMGIDPAKDLAIRTIIVAGEPGGSIGTTRETIEKVWNAELYDFFGLSDIFGACAGMCEAKDGLHIAEDHILVEVLDVKTGAPLPDGERGELVYTTLRKKARPLIRFKTGDIGSVNRKPCSCGRTHARIKIHGRLDDMFIVSGVNVFPSDIEFVIRGTEGITGEYLIRLYEQNHSVKYRLEIEKSDDNNEPDEVLKERVAAALKTRLGVKPGDVTILNDGDLERATHKAKRLIDERTLIYEI
ncbi:MULTISPECIES: phenylacetate--CoA ligase family protein [Acetobacterium]|uniref:Phenylacetate--CoA ligase n=1 Tax=Acetobacterium wieringae TaxID=52694 RepID=A0A5D0WVA1_9FIRM|nr:MULTISPECIES: phenylacetate--CoA ligase [Acetobacterium]OXS24667.1 MAG: CoF synthetase [Acetobacterium sp. MES1]TYC88220.1 phenylacetate--CoA ligase [Acetobacterium wieringae]